MPVGEYWYMGIFLQCNPSLLSHLDYPIRQIPSSSKATRDQLMYPEVVKMEHEVILRELAF